MSQVLTEQDTDVVSGRNEPTVGLSENALRVLCARYLKKNEAGEVTETPADLFRRVARAIAEPEARLYGAAESDRARWEERFYDIIASGAFMPNSPTLMNAGRELGMLSACFVLPVRDSIDEIFDSIKHTALIQKAGGGTGFAFDELRPTGDYIRTSGGTTSGPISFWRAFSEATNAIQQGAFRRGANMGMMYIHHPDILKFLHAKQDLSQFTNYNISVKVTDEWMEAFLADPASPHTVRNPRTGLEYYLPKDLEVWEYNIRSLPRVGDAEVVDGKIGDRELYLRSDMWEMIVQHAWETGEPGVVFIDRINQANPTPQLGRMEATNPCGEQPLLPYEACNLGSINLGAFVVNESTADADVDWDALRDAIRVSTRFLDNVIDANRYPLPEIDRICKANRKIGLGIMGFADALFKLGVPYSSDEGVAWGERFMKFVNDEAHAYSEKLALERGCFPNWKGSTWDTEHRRPMRNACATTVAPTGTISIIAGCSCGVEPLFSLAFYRNVLKGQDEGKAPMLQTNEIFSRAAKARGIYSEGMMEEIARDGTLADIADAPEDMREVFVCAHDITPEWHMRMQAAFQRHCDSSISKTINFTETATPEEVATIYRMAFDLGCKGVTVYRNGCRDAQPMALKDRGRKQSESAASGDGGAMPAQPPIEPAALPEILSGLRIRQMTPFGNMHVKITVDPKLNREMEVFAQLGKGGDVANSDLEAICRLISLWLRSGGSLKHVIQQLKDIGSTLQIPTRHGRIMSLGDALARTLIKYQRAKTIFGLKALLLGEADLSELERDANAGLRTGKKNGHGRGRKNGHGQSRSTEVPGVRHGDSASMPAPVVEAGIDTPATAFKIVCPECGERLRFAEGCRRCEACGWSQC